MGRASLLGILTGASVLGFALIVACGDGRDGFVDPNANPEGGTSSGFIGSEGGFQNIDANTGLPEGETRDPVDCEEAKTSKSYVGCDYWPTVTPNVVWSIFDYAVVVANTGAKEANVTVTGPNAVNKSVTVPAGELRKIYLPWVTSLKGPEVDECGSAPPLNNSVVEATGAYHLVSTSPVIVYQFNALEYKGEGGESPDGGVKDWSTCPGSKVSSCPNGDPQCFSYSNDASLLLPSTAMTNNYRVLGYKGVAAIPILGGGISSVVSVTATQANTEVILTLSSTAAIIASSGGAVPVPATASGKLTIKLPNAGDVAQFVAVKGKDFSGTLVQSDKPVQVIASVPCITIPNGAAACDHIEETVMPAETLGKHYVIPPPTGPKAAPGAVKHAVRIYGNKDNTKLTYAPSKPAKCPDTINAGAVVECDPTDQPFDITGDNEFGVATFLLGAQVYADTKGDPSQTTYASVEQFRTKYVFLAPKDYPVLWADVTATEDADIQIDGAKITAPWTKIGNGPFGVHRVDLTKSGKEGAHTLLAKKPVGVQVIGFGDNTSFQYPAGLNLNLIAPPPPPPK